MLYRQIKITASDLNSNLFLQIDQLFIYKFWLYNLIDDTTMAVFALEKNKIFIRIISAIHISHIIILHYNILLSYNLLKVT